MSKFIFSNNRFFEYDPDSGQVLSDYSGYVSNKKNRIGDFFNFKIFVKDGFFRQYGGISSSFMFFKNNQIEGEAIKNRNVLKNQYSSNLEFDIKGRHIRYSTISGQIFAVYGLKNGFFYGQSKHFDHDARRRYFMFEGRGNRYEGESMKILEAAGYEISKKQ